MTAGWWGYPSELIASPDGQTLYLIGGLDKTAYLNVLNRDLDTGYLSVVQEITQPQTGLPGLATARFFDEMASVFGTPAGLTPVREVYLPLIIK